MNELIDKFLFELFDGLRDKTTVLFGDLLRMHKHWQQSLCCYILE